MNEPKFIMEFEPPPPFIIPQAGQIIVSRENGYPRVVLDSEGEYVTVGVGWFHWPTIANNFFIDTPPERIEKSIRDGLSTRESLILTDSVFRDNMKEYNKKKSQEQEQEQQQQPSTTNPEN